MSWMVNMIWNIQPFFESGKIRDWSSKHTAIPWLSVRNTFPEALIQAFCEFCFFVPPRVRIISTLTLDPIGNGLSVIRNTPLIEISLVNTLLRSGSETSPGREINASSCKSNLSTFRFSITVTILCILRATAGGITKILNEWFPDPKFVKERLWFNPS